MMMMFFKSHAVVSLVVVVMSSLMMTSSSSSWAYAQSTAVVTMGTINATLYEPKPVTCVFQFHERVAGMVACYPTNFVQENDHVMPVYDGNKWSWPSELASKTAVHFSNFSITEQGRYTPTPYSVVPTPDKDQPPSRVQTLKVNAKQVQIGRPGYMPTLTIQPFDLPYGFGVAEAAQKYTEQETYQTYYCDVVTATLSYMRVFLGPDGYLTYFGC
ncbi:hypothetical protein NFJ02_45g112670 [Pycnococcus provasolii]